LHFLRWLSLGKNAKCANERWQKKVGQKKNKFLRWLFCGMFVKA
jgi:hypothetical protein